jgi:hypothetical protein
MTRTIRHLLLFSAVLLAASPAHAYPQWIQVDSDTAIDYNSVKDHGGDVRSVVYSGKMNTFRLFFHCSSWQFQASDSYGWSLIGANSYGETIAYAICPGDQQEATLRRLRLPPASTALPAPPSPLPTSLPTPLTPDPASSAAALPAPPSPLPTSLPTPLTPDPASSAAESSPARVRVTGTSNRLVPPAGSVGSSPSPLQPGPDQRQVKAPRRFDASLEALERDGVVSPREVRRVRDFGRFPRGDAEVIREGCSTGTLSARECGGYLRP